MSDDPMLKDKKFLLLSAWETAVPVFILFCLIIFPITVCILLPMAILSILWMKIFSFQSKAKKDDFDMLEASFITPTTIHRIKPAQTREYDVVIFGATGFTGRLATKYLAKNYNTQIKWAIAGRRADALQDIIKEIKASFPSIQSIPIIIADITNPISIDELTLKTKVVLTTAGPFAKYGEILVKYCAENGTDYCDITGETDWVRKMIDKYDDVARKSGARIVNFCGHDCVPWDLSVLECAKQLKAKGDSLTEVSMFDEINITFSGGTLHTILESFFNRKVYKSRLGFDPLFKTPDGKKSEQNFKVKNTRFINYSSQTSSWVGPFVMAAVMANCVRRSNVLLKYNSKVIYKESQMFPNFLAAYVQMIGLFAFGCILCIPPLKNLFFIFNVLPKPGEGPSQAVMDQGFLKVTAYAKGMQGNRVKSMIYFPADPGYRDTARMLVESGMALVLNRDKIKASGGIHTPASCMGEILMDRLVATGCTLHIE